MNRLVLLRISLVFIALSCCSCEPADKEIAGCEGLIDSISIIDSVESSGRAYHLVLRIAGWHDKTEILEVYDTKPSFNLCGDSKVSPLDGDSLEQNDFHGNPQMVSRVYLSTREKKMHIEYKTGQPDKAHNKNLKLQLK